MKMVQWNETTMDVGRKKDYEVLKSKMAVEICRNKSSNPESGNSNGQ